ncbi:MAG: RnfH family protein [Hydrogenophaga sp.]|nr:RnfH family protein [Hydrogenophaga sp.]
MRVTLVFASAPREVHETVLELPAGTRVGDAVRTSGWAERFGEVDGLSLAVWGRRCSPEQALHDGDRLELLRPLRVDPKVARRERFVGQGARSAGLFAKRRANSKAGY